jgi:hypothetical protein
MKKSEIILIGLLAMMSSCRDHLNYDRASPMEITKSVDFAMNMSPPMLASTVQDKYNPKLIKKGSLVISSVNIEQTKNLIYDFVKRCKGKIISESLEANDPYSYYQIVLNVDASLFDKFFILIDSAKLNITAKTFSTEDVTMVYIDNTTRLENKKKLEKRYLELLSKTKDIKDMLDIEEKLEGIRSDIESRESQMKVMDKQIAYSEIHLKLEKKSINLTYYEKNKYSYKLLQGLASGWQGIKSAMIFLFSIWPLYFLAFGVYYLIRFLRNKRKK